MIDYTINIGILIQLIVTTVVGLTAIGGGLVAIGSFRRTFQDLTRDMTDMKVEIKKVGDVLVTLARTTTRLDNVEQDIRDMKHGRGFIQNRSEGGINGEYS